jgi:hypothetical protein
MSTAASIAYVASIASAAAAAGNQGFYVHQNGGAA